MGLSLRDIGGAFLGGGSMGASLLGLGSAGGSQQPSQTTGLPAWLQPYAQQYIGRAAELSNQPFQAYSGQTNAGINPLQQQAIDMTAARAQAGSDINRAAGGELASTLRGDYLKQGNPYLTGMIDQASQDVTRNFQSAVLPSLDNLAARSGSFGNTGVDQVRGEAFRGLGQQLGNIATTMRGQDYANERNRMQQAVSMAPTIANQDYFDASQLGIAGDAMQGQQQRALDDARRRFEEQRSGPQQQLGILGSALQGNYGTTTTQSQGRGSLAQGALGGAAAGSAFGPWGAAIGGGLGALGSRK